MDKKPVHDIALPIAWDLWTIRHFQYCLSFCENGSLLHPFSMYFVLMSHMLACHGMVEYMQYVF